MDSKSEAIFEINANNQIVRLGNSTISVEGAEQNGISVELVNASESQVTDKIPTYSINSFLPSANPDVEDEDHTEPSSLVQIYQKFNQLVHCRRTPAQTVTSYVHNFENNVIALEDCNLRIDRLLLGFYLMNGSGVEQSKAEKFLPQVKYDSSFSSSDCDEVYTQILENLLAVDSNDNTDIKDSINFYDNSLEDLKSNEVPDGAKTQNLSMEDTSKSIVKVASSLDEATKLIKTTINEIKGNAEGFDNVHDPMAQASEAVERAAQALDKLMLRWKDSSGESFKMCLRKDASDDFVMKIEPELVDMYEEDICNDDVDDDNVSMDAKEEEIDFEPKKVKAVKKLKRLKKVKKGKLAMKKKYKKKTEDASVLVAKDGKKEYPCEECGYIAGDFYRLRRHINSVHLGIKFPCDQCDFAASDSSGLSRHKKSKHEGYRYVCDKCEYAATTSSDLKRHKNSRHEGIRYPCDECDYSATQASNLTQHKKSKHQGVRYLCDQCPYAATAPSDLTRHKKCKHQRVFQCDRCDFVINNEQKLKHHKKRFHEGYSCDQCDFVTPIRNNLRYHKRSKHDCSKYLCDQCEYSTISSSNLLRHKRSNHALEIDPLTGTGIKRKEVELDEKTGLIYDHDVSIDVEDTKTNRSTSEILLTSSYSIGIREAEIKDTHNSVTGQGYHMTHLVGGPLHDNGSVPGGARGSRDIVQKCVAATLSAHSQHQQQHPAAPPPPQDQLQQQHTAAIAGDSSSSYNGGGGGRGGPDSSKQTQTSHTNITTPPATSHFFPKTYNHYLL
eukprot:TRINITY_DN6303_c0_g1_i5.p1 TRINITY_DN6303_c0_g1~~TRINITY_DN6303_c0_g1_i5.p1  ORF type:complete len:782 (+),score=149.59 TRINITY_DN6303_c0_g1_i5:50-2395(+)